MAAFCCGVGYISVSRYEAYSQETGDPQSHSAVNGPDERFGKH